MSDTSVELAPWKLTCRQTPTFSAKPVVAAALDAVRRGILVEIYADLGYDEKVSSGVRQRS